MLARIPLLLLPPFLMMALTGQPNPTVRVISHRGEHLSHPENTIPAFRAAAEVGADFVEMDVRTSRDGRLVLMHDGHTDRTTGVPGEIAKMTFEQIRALDAGVKMGVHAPVPTFAEALAAVKGRCGVYVDIKDARPEDLVREIEAAGMGASAVFYGSIETLVPLHRLRPQWKMMPEAVNLENLERALHTLQAPVIAFDEHDFEDNVIARARKGGALVFVDRLGLHDRPEAWADAVRRGADGIQTDHPAELVRFLREHGRR